MNTTTTATATDRNPDVNHDRDEPIPHSLIPPGCYLHEGKLLVLTARSAKVPFGTAKKRTYVAGTTSSRMETVGLIIRESDRQRFEHALAHKNAKKKYPVTR